MTWNLTSPITGAAQTGLTSPTYTLTVDSASDVNGKQVAVTALGGTQTGVTTHSGSNPFTIAHWKQKIFKILGKPNPVTGVIGSVPVNASRVVTIKGVIPLAGQPYARMKITTLIEVPAGAETADAPNVRAALSAHIGALSQQSAGLGDTVVTNVQ